jgi:hypothetical protein
VHDGNLLPPRRRRVEEGALSLRAKGRIKVARTAFGKRGATLPPRAREGDPGGWARVNEEPHSNSIQPALFIAAIRVLCAVVMPFLMSSRITSV